MLSTALNQLFLYVGFGIPIVLTGMGLPVPEEVFIIAAGLASHNGVLEPWAALLTCVIAAILGDCSMYAIGYHFGHGLVRDHRWFAWLLNPRAERKMEQKIREHGLKALFITRFLVGVRSPVYVAAGVLRIPFRYFIAWDVIAASVVVSVFFGLSYLFAEQINNLWARIRDAEIALTVGIVAGLVAVGAYFYARHRRRIDRIRLRRLRRNRGPDGGASPPGSAPPPGGAPPDGGEPPSSTAPPANGAVRSVSESAQDGADDTRSGTTRALA
ncbi:MAG TPA: DedA family protein [Pirellulales bacterium]|nr:DedA family protein [Pirellulales bacterium]